MLVKGIGVLGNVDIGVAPTSNPLSAASDGVLVPKVDTVN